MASALPISLADFATHFSAPTEVPRWVLPEAAQPTFLAAPGTRRRIEDVLDTVIALQLAGWMQDGVFASPATLPALYDDLLVCARTLGVAVPPAVQAGCSLSAQGAYGTDGNAYLYLSSYFVDPAKPPERRFWVGKLIGHIAARHVTTSTLFALVVDDQGLRQLAKKAVGPVLDVILAPLSLGVRVALSRWHRAAQLSADRAGLICNNDVDGAGRALLRLSLGTGTRVAPADYLDALKALRGEGNPGRWAELIQAHPWTHKRLAALDLFARSECFRDAGGDAIVDESGGLLDDELLARKTRAILGVR